MHPLPKEFSDRIRKDFRGEASDLLSSFDETPISSVHLHPEKGEGLFDGSDEVPWFSRGRLLAERPVFTLDPLFHAGAYYPQESSSMFVHWIMEQLLDESASVNVLDLCASPGGKSILISSLLGSRGRLISNELIKPRNSILRENLVKWGAANTIVTQSDPSAFSGLKQYFDFILVDAPCSGEGMFRKDPGAREEWSPQLVEMCAVRQKDILTAVIHSLRPGGVLIYSTCTLSHDENEDICQWLMNEHDFSGIALKAGHKWPVSVTRKHGFEAYQFLPHRVPGEGFFISAFRKEGGEGSGSRNKPKVIWTEPGKKEVQIAEKWISNEYHGNLLSRDGTLTLSPFKASELNELACHVYITMPGVELGDIIRDEMIPAHSLAMTNLVADEIPRIELTREDALAYLRGSAPSMPGTKGWVIAAHAGCNLGWMKALGNRSNNYFPREWYIRMQGK